MQPQKDRSTTSCTECQRRKQKCSREWPCNHCQSRKVPHLCQFGTKKAKLSPPRDSSARETSVDAATGLRGSKRNLDVDIESSEINGDHGHGLKMWGYMRGHVHYNLDCSSDDDDDKSGTNGSSTETADQVETALGAIPPRSITDAIVNHFIHSVNYWYNSIYVPIFTQRYVQWWSDRASDKRLSPEFTCLLLRILSYSTQYLTTSLRDMVEFELATNCQTLTERFANGAEQLSKSFPPSSTSIERVQEQFLKGAWLKSEGRIVEAWHALGCTIREAQELGIDRDSGMEGRSEYDIEIQRRVWALLFVWDWQMSAWLNRPHQINQKDLSFTLPNLRLDQSTTNPTLPSPFCHIALQAKLGRMIAPLMDDVQSTSNCTTEQITTVLSDIDNFTDELPPIFRIGSTDHSLDEAHPYFIFQRLQLHAVIYMTSLDFVKPFLARDSRTLRTDQEITFLKTGMELALKLLSVGHQMFEHEFPINAKFHLPLFCIFDTSMILCSALIHDRGHVLPRRDEALNMIETSITMLRELSRTTKIGAASYQFLLNLVRAPPDLRRAAGPQGNTKRHRVTGTVESVSRSPTQPRPLSSQSQPMDTSTTNTTTTPSLSIPNLLPQTMSLSTTPPAPFTPLLTLPLIPQPFPETTPTQPLTTIPLLPLNPPTNPTQRDPLPFNLPTFLSSQNPFPISTATTTASLDGSFSAADMPFTTAQPLEMGALEAIWDWEGLDLDFGGGFGWAVGNLGGDGEGGPGEDRGGGGGGGVDEGSWVHERDG